MSMGMGMGACGGCGAPMGMGIGTCGACGWRRNRDSLTSEIGTYMADKAVAEHLEATGQTDSTAADVARAGMQAAKIKIVVGAVAGVIVLIIFLVILSKMHSAANQGAFAPHVLGSLGRASWSWRSSALWR